MHHFQFVRTVIKRNKQMGMKRKQATLHHFYENNCIKETMNRWWTRERRAVDIEACPNNRNNIVPRASQFAIFVSVYFGNLLLPYVKNFHAGCLSWIDQNLRLKNTRFEAISSWHIVMLSTATNNKRQGLPTIMCELSWDNCYQRQSLPRTSW